MTLILALALMHPQVAIPCTLATPCGEVSTQLQSANPPLQTQSEVAAPMVVPAVTEFYGNPGYQVCDMGACTFVEGDPHDPGITVSRRSRPTCLDTRRVLVTTVSGTALCILFQEAQSEWPPIALSGTTTASNSGALATPLSIPHCHMRGRKVRTCKVHKGESK
jgi:hypothetical protein